MPPGLDASRRARGRFEILNVTMARRGAQRRRYAHPLRNGSELYLWFLNANREEWSEWRCHEALAVTNFRSLLSTPESAMPLLTAIKTPSVRLFEALRLQ